MTRRYAQETSGLGSSPIVKVSDVAQRGRVKCVRATITLAAQADGDDIVLGYRPAGSRFLFGMITTDTSLATSTVAIGTTGATGKYRAAAVFTATNTPTLFGLVAAQDDVALTADELLLLTNTTAALPASGVLVVDIYYVES